jgi:hypothetical protein
MHPRPEVGEFFAGLEDVISLQMTALTNVYLEFPRKSFWIYYGPIGLFSGIHEDAIGLFMNVDRSGSVAALAIDPKR